LGRCPPAWSSNVHIQFILVRRLCKILIAVWGMLLCIMQTSKNSRVICLQRLNFICGFALLGCAAAFHFAANAPAQEQTPPLLVMISVDGMRPDYITQADAHGAQGPNLGRFLKEGTYAEGVAGVVPTVTYPSHTTLVTGVW